MKLKVYDEAKRLIEEHPDPTGVVLATLTVAAAVDSLIEALTVRSKPYRTADELNQIVRQLKEKCSGQDKIPQASTQAQGSEGEEAEEAKREREPG